MSKIVRAIDLGWGFTKFTVQSPSGEMGFGMIPSLAPRHSGVDLGGVLLGRRKTVVVTVQGTSYEVGEDSGDIDPSDNTRNLNSDSFVFADQYKAVFLGALHAMATPSIDLLVLGLPLMNMRLSDDVRKMAIGKHEVEGRIFEVRDVVVLGQPVGGLQYCLGLSDVEGFKELHDEVSLIIDPGYLTLDFLVANGSRPIDSRSGAHTGGVSKVLRTMADSISTRYGLKFDNLSVIDKALRKNKLKINGEIVPINPHIIDAKSVIEGSVAYVKNLVGSGADIDNIILIGGGAFIYQKTLQQAYPRHKILTAPNSQFANVMGFYSAGCRLIEMS